MLRCFRGIKVTVLASEITFAGVITPSLHFKRFGHPRTYYVLDLGSKSVHIKHVWALLLYHLFQVKI